MNIHDLLIIDKEDVQLSDLFLPEKIKNEVDQLLEEHQYVSDLLAYNLPVNNKILLNGHSGCGKTSTAKAIANILQKPIYILNLSNVICARIGETSQNIKQIFEKAAREKAILFLDEFDQIGKARGNDDKDVGEMRRLVNTLIQLIDYFPADALLIAATNHLEIIDYALIRRFQIKIDFPLPSQQELDGYYSHLLSRFPSQLQEIERRYNISYAEAKDITFTQLKAKLIAQIKESKRDKNVIGL